MKHKIDQLIFERAPWLARTQTRWPRALLNQMLSYDKTVNLAQGLSNHSSMQIMGAVAGLLARNVQVSGLGHIPHHGPALIVANHPTGIADGVILHSLIARARPDTYFLANRDILRLLPQMADMIAPVEWRHEKRSHGKTRETMAYMRNAVGDGRLGVIFPSGRLAKRRGLRLHERPWMSSASTLARKFDIPVIPINIQARNSALFYLFDLIHPTLRDITLFHETLNKAQQPFRVTVGEPISAHALPKNAEDGIAMLRRATLALGDADQTVSLMKTTRPLLKW